LERRLRLKRRRQERGESSPPPPSPSAPPPRGRFPIDTLPGEEHPLSRFQARKLPEDPASTPWHGHRVNHQTLPAPYEGGGRRPRSGRAVGVIQRERFPDDTSRQGRGPSRPPSPSAPPPRGDSPSIHCPGKSITSHGFRRENSPKILSPPVALYPGQSPLTARPL